MLAADITDLDSLEPIYMRETHQIDEIVLQKRLRNLHSRYSKNFALTVERLVRKDKSVVNDIAVADPVVIPP